MTRSPADHGRAMFSQGRFSPPAQPITQLPQVADIPDFAATKPGPGPDGIFFTVGAGKPQNLPARYTRLVN